MIERGRRLVRPNDHRFSFDACDTTAASRLHRQREHRRARVQIDVPTDEAGRAHRVALEELSHVLGGAQLGSGKGTDRMVLKALLPVVQPSTGEHADQRSASSRQCLERRLLQRVFGEAQRHRIVAGRARLPRGEGGISKGHSESF